MFMGYVSQEMLFKRHLCAVPVTLAGAALIGTAVVLSRILSRSSNSLMAPSQMMLLADSDSGVGTAEEKMELMVDSHGNPVELGSGSFGKVAVQNHSSIDIEVLPSWHVHLCTLKMFTCHKNRNNNSVD